MSFALNNVATIDTYPTPPAGSSLQCVGGERVNLQIVNAAALVEYTFRDIDGTTTLSADTFLAPGMYSFSKSVNLLRFKSAVTGLPARITAEVLLAREL